VIVLLITEYETERIRSELKIREIVKAGINYDAFREMRITDELIEEASNRIIHLCKKHKELQNLIYMDPVGYITFSMLARDYDLLDQQLIDENTFLRGISTMAESENFQELYRYYDGIFSDLMYFPVPKLLKTDADISYEDSWYVKRSYGGDRRHEGTDLMASNDTAGYFPVISITDGVVEKIGWLEKGGYRVGIRSTSGGYFYYAHLDTYAPDLQQGDTVIAGQLLGLMGDSGYGPEGTVGKFDVHLHLGIYVQTITGEMSINPYPILTLLEKRRLQYNYE
jgi:murein DD-endopeptidase MepM/ murein hydrolase activator NlpD